MGGGKSGVSTKFEGFLICESYLSKKYLTSPHLPNCQCPILDNQLKSSNLSKETTYVEGSFWYQNDQLDITMKYLTLAEQLSMSNTEEILYKQLKSSNLSKGRRKKKISKYGL